MASALFLAILTPFVKIGCADASYQAKRLSFASLNRNDLHQKILAGGEEDVDLAGRELGSRGYQESDRVVFATTFGNKNISQRARHIAGVHLTECPPPHPEELISLVARELYSEDPDMQLSAAWILSTLAPDAPPTFEINWGTGGRKLFWERYWLNVPLFQKWWKSRSGG